MGKDQQFLFGKLGFTTTKKLKLQCKKLNKLRNELKIIKLFYADRLSAEVQDEWVLRLRHIAPLSLLRSRDTIQYPAIKNC